MTVIRVNRASGRRDVLSHDNFVTAVGSWGEAHAGMRGEDECVMDLSTLSHGGGLAASSSCRLLLTSSAVTAVVVVPVSQ